MKIGELAKLSGLAPSRIRYYETCGLIASQPRGSNGYRAFAPQTLQLLEIIKKAQQVGFALEEIRHLLPTVDSQGWQHGELLGVLRRKVAEIEAMQQRLQQNREQLLAVIDSIEHKPQGQLCTVSAEQVIASLLE